MFRTCIGCAGHLVSLSCRMKHTDYNLTLIKPLAGMGASKASGVPDEKERRRVEYEVVRKEIGFGRALSFYGHGAWVISGVRPGDGRSGQDRNLQTVRRQS